MRESPGSPSQMNATLLRRPSVRCRSRQLYAALSLPPTNHFANGKFHSRTLSYGLNHESSSPHSPQNFSGSCSARRQIASYSSRLLIDARRENSAGGGNFRASLSTDSIS